MYIRPLVQIGPARPDDAHTLAGGWGWFTHVECLYRGAPAKIVHVDELDQTALQPLTTPRANILDLDLGNPVVMGIVNVTPDSFSDGGLHAQTKSALRGARNMVQAGAHILDIGGESTRPGADYIAPDQEIARVAPVVEAVRGDGIAAVISNDTRKAAVADAALSAGADLINDVSGFTHDPALAPLCAARGVPVCVMHAQGDPATMQQNPQYDDVLLDVYDFLLQRIEDLVAMGIKRSQIIADPGIGFGKTLDHNLALLSRLSLFHSLGVPILLGASRKRFIGTLGNAPDAAARMPGSVAVALAALEQGVQIVRVHDVAETTQAIALWRASRLTAE